MESFIEEEQNDIVDFKDEDLRDADIDLRTDDLIHTEELNMSGNQLTLDNGQLTNAIAKSTIKKLDLSKNNIGTEGVKHLASLLLVNKSLQTLDLSGNNISDDSKKPQSLPSNKLVGICGQWSDPNPESDPRPDSVSSGFLPRTKTGFNQKAGGCPSPFA